MPPCVPPLTTASTAWQSTTPVQPGGSPSMGKRSPPGRFTALFWLHWAQCMRGYVAAVNLQRRLNRRFHDQVQEIGAANNGGSRALGFWVGLGAGKTYLAVKGRLIDAGTGKELATFVDQEKGFKGVTSMES